MDRKTLQTTTLAVLSTSLILTLHANSLLGDALFSHQLALTLVLLSLSPLLYHLSLTHTPSPLLIFSLALILVPTTLLPVAARLLSNLFFGHRVANSQWYHAVWRVHAIVLIWIGLAVLNERVIRPWWQGNSDKLLAPMFGASVQGRADNFAREKREKHMGAIRDRVSVVLKKKKLAVRSKETREAELVAANDALAAADALLKGAEARGDDAEVAIVEKVLSAARLRMRAGDNEVARAELEIEEATATLAALQVEWEAGRPLGQYVGFYR